MKKQAGIGSALLRMLVGGKELGKGMLRGGADVGEKFLGAAPSGVTWKKLLVDSPMQAGRDIRGVFGNARVRHRLGTPLTQNTRTIGSELYNLLNPGAIGEQIGRYGTTAIPVGIGGSVLSELFGKNSEYTEGVKAACAKRGYDVEKLVKLAQEGWLRRLGGGIKRPLTAITNWADEATSPDVAWTRQMRDIGAEQNRITSEWDRYNKLLNAQHKNMISVNEYRKMKGLPIDEIAAQNEKMMQQARSQPTGAFGAYGGWQPTTRQGPFMPRDFVNLSPQTAWNVVNPGSRPAQPNQLAGGLGVTPPPAPMPANPAPAMGTPQPMNPQLIKRPYGQ